MRLTLTLLALLFSATIYAGEWITDTKSGCKLWNPNPVPNETIVYSGECVDGKANGKGSDTWYQNGKKTSHYEGRYKDGNRKNGKGSETIYKDGEMIRYMEGEFKDYILHGKGSETEYKNREVASEYKGDYKNGKPNGVGIATTNDGEKRIQYKGEFKDGITDGKSSTTKGVST